MSISTRWNATLPGLEIVNVGAKGARPSRSSSHARNGATAVLLTTIVLVTGAASCVLSTSVNVFAPGLSATPFAKNRPLRSWGAKRPLTMTAALAGARTVPPNEMVSPATLLPSTPASTSSAAPAMTDTSTGADDAIAPPASRTRALTVWRPMPTPFHRWM